LGSSLASGNLSGSSGSASRGSYSGGGGGNSSAASGNLDFWAANQVAKEQLYLADNGSQDAVASFMANNLGLDSSTSDSVTIPGLLNPGESPMSMHNDSSFTGYTTFADLGSLNQMQSYGVGYQYGSGEREQLRLERQALQSARNLATQGDQLQSMQAESANYYSQGQANANNAESYLSYTFGGIFSQAGYGLARGAQGLYRLVTDTDTKILFANSLVSTWRDPGAVIRSAANGIDHFSKLSIGDQAGEVLKFGLETVATAGAGKLAGMAGQASINFVENSQWVFRPNYGQLNSLSVQALTGSVERITTVTPEMSKAFQGMGYLDPIDNVFKSAPLNATMAVDHIFPSAEIAKMPGFNTLTREQMTNILQDKLEFGNLQPLPKTFNSSKGSLLDWDTYKGQALDVNYVENLMSKQVDIRIQIQKQISDYQKLNRNGVK